MKTHTDYIITNDEGHELRRNRTQLIQTNKTITHTHEDSKQNPLNKDVNNTQIGNQYTTRYGRVIKPVSRLGY